MKLAGHTLIDIEHDLRSGVPAPSILRGFARVNELLLRLLATSWGWLSTMSPSAYAEIHSGLGQGSGQDSPGYRALTTHAKALWPAFRARFPGRADASPEGIYRTDTAAFASLKP